MNKFLHLGRNNCSVQPLRNHCDPFQTERTVTFSELIASQDIIINFKQKHYNQFQTERTGAFSISNSSHLLCNSASSRAVTTMSHKSPLDRTRCDRVGQAAIHCCHLDRQNQFQTEITPSKSTSPSFLSSLTLTLTLVFHCHLL